MFVFYCKKKNVIFKKPFQYLSILDCELPIQSTHISRHI